MNSCYLSSSLCRNYQLKDAIIECGKLSNKYVELSAPHPYLSVKEISKILKNFLKEGYKFTLHNYFPPPEKSFVLNIASNEKNTQNLCKKLVDDALKLSVDAKSSVYGLHAGYLSKAKAKDDGMFEFDKETMSYSNALERSLNFINTFIEKFNNKNVKFLVENLFPSISRNSSLNCNFEQISDLMDNLPKEVGLLLDLGHMNISSKIMEFDKFKFLDKYLSKYGDRLYEIHISENNGFKDEHRALETNSWQYDAISLISQIKNLDKCEKERIYCLESRNAETKDIKSNLDKINSIINSN